MSLIGHTTWRKTTLNQIYVTKNFGLRRSFEKLYTDKGRAMELLSKLVTYFKHETPPPPLESSEPELKSKFPTIPDQVQVYHAENPTVVDGDTLTMMVYWWGGAEYAKLKLRLAGIDSPEKRTLEGKNAETYVKVWCAAKTTTWQEFRTTEHPFLLIITGPDKYQPRWNAILYSTLDGECLNQTLLDQKLATEYPKRKAT